ncbi:RHS repeat-associated core domain-containing protein [Glycomyces salinus]|uniref:RHS repeat-associated core domain-containing protein n=1 Tax=Glycomyces salinus TaxID=980294 RepID=UPI0018ED983D|nr:RHS repeat-associated core domain-containing protein [Glycomyces salinus]
MTLLTTGPAWAQDFQRDPQQFGSTSVSSVGAAESAFEDNARSWDGTSDTAAGSGDWTATDLSSAGSWTQGGSSGAYSYTYGMRVPPATGPSPDVALSYSSASHDGLTSGTNNQASWVGDGWNYSPGFIERSYTSCGAESEQDGNNGEDPTGDLCWDDESPSITMSLNGTNTALVLDDDSGEWRAASDANWRIELLGSAASPSASTSERWKVTTTDGTQYFFASEPSESRSRWTVPVFGNHSGEPCHSSGDFEGSHCKQAYRWMLDEVVDVHGNASRYYYATETGYYAPAVDSESSAVSYTRSGWLKRIEYGLRSDNSVEPTGEVRFNVSDRCLEDCYNSTGDPKSSNWPDVPWDLDCESGTGCEQYSPVFFSTKRLTEITTYVWNAGAGAFDDVDSWSLSHEFKDYGDSSQVVLWLSSVQHTGLGGGSETMPPVEFGATFLPNRVDDGSANPGVWRPRLTSVKNETGGTVSITYSPPDCSAGSLPADPEDNTRRCYPARYTPEGVDEPVEAYFHKYVVAEVIESDSTGGGDDVRTFYDYSTAGGGTAVLWAWDDSEFTEDDKRTYNQWRGYAQVTTRVGDPQDPGPQLRSATRYFRGMDGQPLPDGGERSVELTDTHGNTVTDHEALAGQVWEQISYDDTTVIGSTTTRYWSRKTATRDHDGGELDAWMTGPSRVDARTRLSDTAWRTTRTTTTYDDYGRGIEVSHHGDTTADDDEQCIRTEYADNTAAWILDAPARVETVAVPCDADPSRPDDVVSDVRAYYDGHDFGAAPTRGLMTRSEILDEWDAGPIYVTLAESTFDSLGRETSAIDALGEETTTAYTPADASGPVTAVTTTNPLGHVQEATYAPTWGAMLTATSAGGQVTAVEYDSLGRRTAVWLPGQDRGADDVPNLKFSYAVSDTEPSAVTTETMIWNESYLTKIALYDGLLRPRQTQADTYDGRLITQTVYNSRGQVDYISGANFNNDSGPTSDLVRISRTNDVSRTEYIYDGAGRVTDEIFVVKDDERWRTTTSYGGHDDFWQTTVTPPQGASATATLEDARGRTVELRQFHGNEPTGDFDATSYDYTNRGQLATVTDPAENQWTFGYDLRGRQIAADDPDTGHSTTEYNAADQVTSTTDAIGTTLSYEYDPLGRKTARWEGGIDNGTLLSEWTYDGAENGIGLPHTSTNWIDGQAWTKAINEYDEAGRPKETSTFLPEAAGPLAGEYWEEYTYHPDGSLRYYGTVGAGDLHSEVMLYGYNEMGQPSRVASQSRDFFSTVYVDKAVYSPYGQLLQRRLGDPNDNSGGSGQVWQTWIYEEGTGRLAEFYFDKLKPGEFDGTNYGIAALAYEYDQAGNILSITDEPVHSADALQPETQCFEYDHRNRLTEAWAQAGAGECAEAPSESVIGGPGAYWSSYEYDLTGNRTSETRWTTGGRMTDTYTYESTGHALTEVATEENGGERDVYTYNEAGFTTSIDRAGDLSILDWAPTGRLETVANGEETTSFFDDADGDRLARIDPNGDITAWAAGYELTYDANQNTIEVRRYYRHGNETIGLRIGRGHIQWLSGDHHGTDQWVVNGGNLTATVRRFDPFGNQRGLTKGEWPDQRGFVGGIENETSGLTTLGAREYDPTTGRFSSVDPIAVYTNAQQLNGYAYSLNSPVTFTDPTGLIPAKIDGYGGGGSGSGGNNSDVLDPANGCSYYYGCESADAHNGTGCGSCGGKYYGEDSWAPSNHDVLDPANGCSYYYGCDAFDAHNGTGCGSCGGINYPTEKPTPPPALDGQAGEDDAGDMWDFGWDGIVDGFDELTQEQCRLMGGPDSICEDLTYGGVWENAWEDGERITIGCIQNAVALEEYGHINGHARNLITIGAAAIYGSIGSLGGVPGAFVGIAGGGMLGFYGGYCIDGAIEAAG